MRQLLALQAPLFWVAATSFMGFGAFAYLTFGSSSAPFGVALQRKSIAIELSHLDWGKVDAAFNEQSRKKCFCNC